MPAMFVGGPVRNTLDDSEEDEAFEEEGLMDLEVENFRESVAFIFQDWVGQGLDLDFDQAVQRVQRLAGRALAGHEEGWGPEEQQTWALDAWG